MMLRYELKKFITKRLNFILLLLVLFLAVVFSIFAIHSFRFTDIDGNLFTGLRAARRLVGDKNKWKGTLSPEKIYEIVSKRLQIETQYPDKIPNDVYGKELQSYSDIIFTLSEMLNGEKSDYNPNSILQAKPLEIKSIYDIYRKNLVDASKDYGTTPEKEAFMMKQYERITLPFYYEAADSWDTMLLYATTYSLVLIIAISFLTAGIFSEEFNIKADSVFFSCRYGRSKAVKNKILAGLCIATAIYFIGIGILSLICFSVMGISGVFTSYQFYRPYSIYALNLGQMYLIVVISGYAAGLLAASVSMLIASKSKSFGLAVSLPLILFFVSPFIGRVLPFRTFFTLTPDQLTNIVNCARIPYIYQAGKIVFKQIPFIIIFYSVSALLMLPIVYRNYRKLLSK